MSNIKASTLRNRKANNETALDRVNARILSGNLVVEIEYKEVNGYKVRVPNAELPVSRDDVVNVINRQRAVSKEELLEAVGMNVTNFLVKKGYIRVMNSSTFMVTVEAQKHYKLAKPVIGNYFA